MARGRRACGCSSESVSGAADRQPASRQLSRRHHQVCRAARTTTIYYVVDMHAITVVTRRIAEGHPRSDRLHRLRHRPEKPLVFNQSQVSGRRACLDFQPRRAHGLAQPHDPVQGRPARTARTLRSGSCLSQLDGGRHSGLPRDHVPVGDDQKQHLELARHCAEIQQRLFRPIQARAATGHFSTPGRQSGLTRVMCCATTRKCRSRKI